MSDKKIIEYVRSMIVDNLAKRNYWQEVIAIKVDKTNKELLAHIDGLIELFQKAKEIIERKNNKNERNRK